MAERFDELERTAAVVYADCAGIWVMTIFAAPTLADMNGARPALNAMARRHPRGFPTLTWILPEAGFKMDGDARKAAADITREHEAKIMAQATLIEGSGFQSAAVRAIIAGVDLMSRSKYVKKVFSELPEAVAWCIPHRPALGARGASEQIAAAILGVRSSIPDTAPIA
jgi:hypothetical protein